MMPFSVLFQEFRTGKLIRLQEAVSVRSPDLLKTAKIEVRGRHEVQRLADAIDADPSSFMALGLEVCSQQERTYWEDWLPLLTGLRVHRELRVLCLRGNKLRDGGIGLVAEMLARSKSLTYLDVGETGFRSEGAEDLAQALAENQNGLWYFGRAFEKNKMCTVFDASGTNISSNGGDFFAETALQRGSALTALDLGDNPSLAHGVAELFSMLEDNPSSLEVLLLGACEIPHHAMGRLGELLQDPEVALTTLGLSENALTPESATMLGSVLQGNQTLRSLKLSYNTLGDGIRGFVTGLRSNRTLTELDLSHCGIWTACAKYLGQILQTNRTLTDLRLGGNDLGCVGVAEIAMGLRENSSLRTLGLRGTNLEDEGVKELSMALTQNRTLQDLVLTDNPTGAPGYQALAKAMEQNVTLKSLSLSHWATLEDAGLQENWQLLQRSLQRNRQPLAMFELVQLEETGSSSQLTLKCAPADPVVVSVSKNATPKELRVAVPQPDPSHPCLLLFRLPNGRFLGPKETVETAFFDALA